MLKIPKPKLNLLDLQVIYQTMQVLYDLRGDEFEDYNFFDVNGDEHTTCYKTRRLFTVIRKMPDIWVSFYVSKLYNGYHFELHGGSDIGNARPLWKWDSPYDEDDETDDPEHEINLNKLKEDLKKHDDIYEEFMDIIEEIKIMGGIN